MVDINLVPREYRRRKERFTKLFSKTGGWVLALLILSLLLYGGLLFYESRLNESLENIDEQIANLDIERDLEIEETMIDLDRKLKVLKGMFESHLYWSKLISKIEEATVSKVYFSDSNFILEEGGLKVTFPGNALSYTDLARQMVSFQEESAVKSVTVSGIALSEEGGIDFDFKVIFSKDILLGLEIEND